MFLSIVLSIAGCQMESPKSIQRIPTETLSSEGVAVSVYSYDNFSKFMEADNDTTYVINFWATWCGPCVAELPCFEELYQNYKNEKIRFVFVSLDFEKQIEEKLLPFLLKNELHGEVLVLSQKGMNGWIGEINPSWSGTLPATLIYNKVGSDFYPHSFEYKELEKALKKRL
jgi:thiol-disulfide isomerase/thioredoxin